MIKTLSAKYFWSILLVLILVVLPFGSVFAASTYTFTDEFNNAVFLDTYQTLSVQNSNGQLRLMPGVLNGSATSTSMNSAGGNVTNATLITNTFFPPNPSTYINYYLSNDNGVNWHLAEIGRNVQFNRTGSQLRWRAIVSRSNADLDPRIDFVTVQYTVDTSTPANTFSFNNGTAGIADPHGLVCQTLAIVGLSCNASQVTQATTNAYQPQPVALDFSIFGSSNGNGNGVSNSSLTGSIATAGTVKDLAGNEIMLVKTANSSDIYRIANGRKHKFPTMSIFYDYGYTLEMVETITQNQLDKYPRSYPLQVYKDKKNIYYLTEGGMTRLIPNDKKVFNSYGDREEDIINISKKEFNYYPVNQFVFLEQPLNRDVFQITGNSKRYLTPMAVARLKIKDDQIAPINQTQLDFYKTLAPVIN